jgi:PAS domain S-box-containing protein
MSVEELTGKRNEDLPLSSHQLEQFATEDRTIAETGTSISLEEESQHPHSGEVCHFVVTKKLLLDAEGNRNILGVVTDVSDLKSHQDKVQKSEFLLQQIFNKVADALLIIDFETLLIEDGNAKAMQLFAYTEPDFLRKRHLHSMRPARESAPAFWTKLLKESGKETTVAETELLDFSGKSFWGSLAITSFLQDNRRFILLRITDISRQKETEEHIIQSLHEKEILIQEIHHRVKNNMAVISSLLQLQSGYIKDERLAEVFRDSQSRIKSMALIHEKLYQSSTLARVEMESYIKELTRTLYYTYKGGKIHLDVNTLAQNVFLDINSAVPCGLIINEVFSNACKHAFKGRSNGKININFVREGDFYELEIKDDGIGMPAGTNFAKFQSLGMNLVQALASQLGASLDYLQESGFGIRLRFQEKVKPGREKVLPGR